jgi:stage II sporulation protein AA (anti-sigma F factor antagonist)
MDGSPQTSIANCEITVANRNGCAIVFVAGEMDASDGQQLEDALLEAQHGSANVIVDMNRLTFMDSTGINALVLAWRRVSGELHVVGARPAVRRVFEIAGVTDLLPDEAGFTWQQLTHHRSGWRQWLTREANHEGVPLAEIIEVGPWPGYGTDHAHYLLETTGSTSLYRSLDDAMRAAEDPESVTPLTKRAGG